MLHHQQKKKEKIRLGFSQLEQETGCTTIIRGEINANEHN